MILSQILTEASKMRQLKRNIVNFLGNEEADDDDDDILLSLVDTDNANKPDDKEVDEDTLMQIFQSLGGADEEGAEDLANPELVGEPEYSITESELNAYIANGLAMATALYEVVTGVKGWDRDSHAFCESATGDGLSELTEACKNEGCKKIKEGDDFDDLDDDDDDIIDDDEFDDDLFEAFTV